MWSVQNGSPVKNHSLTMSGLNRQVISKRVDRAVKTVITAHWPHLIQVKEEAPDVS